MLLPSRVQDPVRPVDTVLVVPPLVHDQILELTNALEPLSLTKSFVDAIENGLGDYEANRRNEKVFRAALPAFNAQVRMIRDDCMMALHLRTVAAMAGDDVLASALDRQLRQCERVLCRLPERVAGRPPNRGRAALAVAVVAALDQLPRRPDDPDPIEPGKNAIINEVLRLVLRWADELEGLPSSPPRKHLYNFAWDSVEAYHRTQRKPLI